MSSQLTGISVCVTHYYTQTPSSVQYFTAGSDRWHRICFKESDFQMRLFEMVHGPLFKFVLKVFLKTVLESSNLQKQ